MRRDGFPPNSGGKNDWGLTYNTDYPVSKNKNRDDEKRRFTVKVCPSCQTAFELVPNQYRKKSEVHYYSHFYTRGLNKQVCPKCT